MGRILLDTDVLINLLEKEKREICFRLINENVLHLSTISIFEFLHGVYRTNKNAEKIKKFIDKYFKVLNVEQGISKKAAEISVELAKDGKILDARDLLIASTAIVHNLWLWTENRKHFNRLEGHGLRFYSGED